MTKDEALQMALDALNNFDKGNHGMKWQAPIIKAIRAALAQPEHPDAQGSPCPEFWNWLPKAYGQTESFSKYNMEVAYLAGKQSQLEPEPVAWMHNFIDYVITKNRPTDITRNAGRWTPLYTAPPQREWQGLTGEELQEIYQAEGTVHFKFSLIEAKLKEKNT
jgi:hypothetical protein